MPMIEERAALPAVRDTEPRRPILSIHFREPSSGAIGSGGRKLDLFPGDVLDASELGAAANTLIDALAGRSSCDEAPTLHYLGLPREAWPVEDILAFQACIRPSARQVCCGGMAGLRSFHCTSISGSAGNAVTERTPAIDTPVLREALVATHPLFPLAMILGSIPDCCRVVIIDPLAFFIDTRHQPAALELLAAFAASSSRVIVCATAEPCPVH